MSETNTPAADLVVDTPAAAPLPVEHAAPVETEVKAEPALELHTDTPTLLEAVAKPVEEVKTEAPVEVKPEPEKPVEAKPAETEVKPAEPEVKPEPEVKYEFKLPEGFNAPKEALDGYTGVLKETGVAPEVGQRLLDMHLAEVQRMADAAPQQWQQAFKATRDGWVQQVLADPQLGGSGHQTAMTAAARGRDTLTRDWSPQQKGELESYLRTTGSGDHPVFLRLLYSAARLTDEPAPPPPAHIPSASNGARPGAGFKGLYDHPGSAPRSR